MRVRGRIAVQTTTPAAPKTPKRSPPLLRLETPFPTTGSATIITPRAFSAASPLWAHDSATATIREAFSPVVLDLRRDDRTAIPKGCHVARAVEGCAPLVGIAFAETPGYEGTVKKDFDANAIPRVANLSPESRRAETAFAEYTAKHTRKVVARFEEMVGSDHSYTVDNAKRCFEAWGDHKSPKNDDEKRVRAEQNVALHATATVIANLAFLQRLDVLASQPGSRVLITCGGCGAGKGRALQKLEENGRKLTYGAIYDAAGEGEATELTAIIAACRSRGIHVDVLAVQADVSDAAKRVIDRGSTSGRVVDLVAFARSHTTGVDNFRALVAQASFCSALKNGEVSLAIMESVANGEVITTTRRTLAPPSVTLQRAIEIALYELTQAPGVAPETVRGALAGIARYWPENDHWFASARRKTSA